MAKRLEDNEALSTRAMKKLIEKQKIVQDQEKLIKEKEKDSTELLAAAESLHETPSTRAMNSMMDYDTHSRVSSRNGRILPSQPSNSPPPYMFETSETPRDESIKIAEFF